MKAMMQRRTFLAGLAVTPLLALFDKVTFGLTKPTVCNRLHINSIGLGHGFAYPGNQISVAGGPWRTFTVPELRDLLAPGDLVEITYTDDPEGEMTWTGRFSPGPGTIHFHSED